MLEASRIGHDFGSRRVLDDVDLRLEPGALLAVIGPNGSGKTTLVRVLSGVLTPRSGRVLLSGQPLEGIARREIARSLAVVPQESFVPFPFNVRELVTMGRAPFMGALGRESATDRELVEGALRTLGLKELAERSFPTLSGGEKQRVVLARALAQGSPILLLDEPTAHMDLGHRIHTFEWVRSWVGGSPKGRAALLVTHDLVLAARFCDRVVLLHEGRIHAAGRPAEVLTPARIAEVYGVDATVSEDASGRLVIVAERSRIRYLGSDGDDR